MTINKILRNKFIKNKIDVATLSSTHLPFLLSLLENEFPQVRFLDPALSTAKKIAEKTSKTRKNSLRIYTSGNTKEFQKYLKKLGIRNKVNFLSF